MSNAPPYDPSVKSGSRRGCGAPIVFVMLAIAAVLTWRDFRDLVPWEAESEDVDEAPPSAVLDSGQVVVGDFEILTIEQIWAEGDVVGAMNVAIEKDPVWLRRLLEEEGIDPNLRLLYPGSDGWAHPLEKAVRQGSQETFEILLAAGANPNGQGSDGDTALHTAARKGFRTPIEQLLAAGADPNLPNASGGTALEAAARKGNRDELETLLAAGAELRFVLHAAAWGGHVKIIRLLLDRGADPTALTQYGDSALRGAADDKYLEATAILLAAGTRPCEQSLRKAAAGGHDETLRAYAKAGFRFDVPPAYWDALYSASYAGQADTVKLLLELGASPHGGEGLDAPIHAAIEQGHDEVVAVLVAAGVKPPAEAMP